GVRPSLTPPRREQEGAAQNLGFVYRPIDLTQLHLPASVVGRLLRNGMELGCTGDDHRQHADTTAVRSGIRLAYHKRIIFHQSLLHCLVVHSLKPKILRRRPRPVQTQISEKRRLIIMVAMALGAFGIGTTEFVSMGLLSMI